MCVFIGLLFVCRLNSGPVRGFSADVGNRTSIRMSYPEGSPKVWEDTDSDIRFVAVIYKSVDFHWLRAMITNTSVVSACSHIRQIGCLDQCGMSERQVLLSPFSRCGTGCSSGRMCR